MRLEFLELKVRNFLSFGNVEQTIKLNKDPYTLITGLNKDKSVDDSGNVNGVGKTTIFQSLHYALFGKSIGNKVTLPTLVNNINKKHMEVTLTFNKDGTNYKIERGRNPNYLHFYKEEDEITDESLGDSRDTQSIIEDIIGMNEDLFCQTILLSCNVPIFMDQSTANQKLIIEKVLGIDIITKKINSLKEVIKQTKNDITQEDFKIQTLKSQASTLELTYKSQYEAMRLEQQIWSQNHTKQLEEKKLTLKALSAIDYNEEYNIIKAWEHYSEANKQYQDNLLNIKTIQDSKIKKNQELSMVENKIVELEKIDIESYKSMFVFNEQVDRAKSEYNNQILEKNKVKARYTELVNGIQQLTQEKDKLSKKKESYLKNVCPTCGQPLDKEVAEQEIKSIDVMIQQFSDAEHKINMEILDVNNDLQTNYPEDNRKFEYKDTSPYNNVMELLDISNQLNSYKKDVENIKQYIVLLNEQLNNIIVLVPDQPTKTSQFKTEQELFATKAQQEQLVKDIEELEKVTTNPYDKNVIELEGKLKEIVYPSEETLKELQSNQEHNEMLLKLLNSPNSYIRQAILDKSLEFLNGKIRYYLNKLGSLHVVKFNNDMSIDITSNGLEFGYISSGELGRVSIALTFAFRDAWENLSGMSSNLLMVDELLDRSGLDENGVQMMLSCLLEDKSKNLFLVSHNPIVTSQVKNKMLIVKDRGFSTIET